MIEFEIRDIYGERRYVRVVETFTHHYTGELMRRIRTDSLEPHTVHARTMETFINEADFAVLLERRIVE